MDLNPSDLVYFFEVSKTSNISRAAERLGVGQPTLSQAIHRLESYFGAKLLDRFKTGVKLTVPGKRLVARGQVAIEGWNKLKEEVSASETEIQGTFTIGCHPSVGLYALPVFLRELLSKHPRLEIRLMHGLSREMTEEVVSFRCDFGIVINPVRHPDLVIKELCRDQVGYWSAKNSLEDTLICDPSLMQSQELMGREGRQAKSEGQSTQSKPSRFTRRIESSSLEMIGCLAQSGCGVAILPERVAKRFAGLHWHKPGAKPALPKFEDRLCLVYRADRAMSATARVIADAIRAARI